MTARVSMLLNQRASLTCFRACFLRGRAKDLSAHRVIPALKLRILFTGNVYLCCITFSANSDRSLHSVRMPSFVRCEMNVCVDFRTSKYVKISCFLELLKCKLIPVQAWTGPEVSRSLRLQGFQKNRHTKVVRLSALHPGRFYPPPQEIFLVLIFCRPGSSVGIATDYGLDGLGSNPGGDEIFLLSRLALGSKQPPVQWVPGLFRG